MMSASVVPFRCLTGDGGGGDCDSCRRLVSAGSCELAEVPEPGREGRISWSAQDGPRPRGSPADVHLAAGGSGLSDPYSEDEEVGSSSSSRWEGGDRGCRNTASYPATTWRPGR